MPVEDKHNPGFYLKWVEVEENVSGCALCIVLRLGWAVGLGVRGWRSPDGQLLARAQQSNQEELAGDLQCCMCISLTIDWCKVRTLYAYCETQGISWSTLSWAPKTWLQEQPGDFDELIGILQSEEARDMYIAKPSNRNKGNGIEVHRSEQPGAVQSPGR